MADIRKGTVTANGIRFATLEAGEGPLFLCLHGFPDNAWSFREQLTTFAEAGYRVVAPFMRGYAPTEPAADGRYQSAVLAEDAVALIAALGSSRAHVYGHDWGALAAYGAALLAPERIGKLVTGALPYGPAVANALLTDYDQQRRSWYMFFFQQPFAEVAVAEGDFRFLERLWRDWSPGWRYGEEELELLKETFRRPGVLQAALAYYRCTLNPALQDPALAELQARMTFEPIPVPTLALHGAGDGCMGVGLLDGMENFFPAGLRKLVLPDVGHFVHREKPREANAAILSFLNDE